MQVSYTIHKLLPADKLNLNDLYFLQPIEIDILDKEAVEDLAAIDENDLYIFALANKAGQFY